MPYLMPTRTSGHRLCKQHVGEDGKRSQEDEVATPFSATCITISLLSEALDIEDYAVGWWSYCKR